MMRTIVFTLVLILTYQLFSIVSAKQTRAENIQKNWFLRSTWMILQLGIIITN